jgi:hypothetical protein
VDREHERTAEGVIKEEGMEQPTLRDKVRHVLSQSGDAFETSFPGARERLVDALTPAFENLLRVLVRLEDAEVQKRRSAKQPDGYMLVWHLLWDACNGLLAAFVLVQRGYETEAIAVTRTVLERVACAIVLFDNPQIISRFMAGHMKDLSTKAIGPAGRVVTDLATMWGWLSELGSHIGKDNIGTGFLEVVRGEGKHQLHMAIGGRVPASGEMHEAVESFMTELCNIATSILTPAPDQILFNEHRQRATLGKA